MRNDKPYDTGIYMEVDLVSDENATIAVVSLREKFPVPGAVTLYSTPDGPRSVPATSVSVLYYTGSAKREPGDARNPSVGKKLALSRALRSVADELEAAAQAEVKAVYGDA